MIVHQNNTLYKINLSIVLAICCFIAIAFGIDAFYHPDVLLIKQNAKKLLLPILLHAVQPEPKEKTMFLSAIILLPTLIALFLYLFRNITFNNTQKKILEIGTVVTYSSIGLVTLFAKDQSFAGSLIFQTYFRKLFFFNYSFLYFSATILLILLYVYFLKRNFYTANKLMLLGGILCFVVLPILIVFCGTITEYPHGVHHFDAVFYSQSQVNMGVPLFVNGFTNTYGLYPHFLQPIFKILGLSVYTFTLVMSILIVLCFVSLFWFLLRETKSTVISIIGIGSIVFSYLFWKYQSYDEFFQYFPIRTFFPCVLLLLASFYNKNRNRLLYISTTILCAVNILWNPDIGLFTTISWIAFITYCKTVEKENLLEKLKLGFKPFIISIVIIAVTITCFELVMYVSYWAFPDLTLLFSTLYVFSGLGFNMLPMQMIHPWIVFAFWLLIGFGLSINSYLQNRKDNSILFLLTLVCIGFFCYYQGRSHSYVFLSFLPFFLTLLCLLLSKIDFGTTSMQVKLFYLSSYCIILMSIPTMIHFDLLFFRDPNNLYGKIETPKNIQSNIAFIKKYTKPNEKILIQYDDKNLQGLYHNATQTISIFNPGVIELFFISDSIALNNLLKTRKVKIFKSLKNLDSTVTCIDDNGDIGLCFSKPTKKENICH